MRRSRFRTLKLLATLAMIASLSGLFSLSATAAPGSLDSGTRAPEQAAPTQELCHELDTNEDLSLSADELDALGSDYDRNEVEIFCDNLPSITVPGIAVGTVSVAVQDCSDVTEATWDATGAECVESTTPVTLAFARHGEGEQPSFNLDVTGSDSRVLAAGTWTVTASGPTASTDFEVVAGQDTPLTLQLPATPEPETFPVTIAADTEDEGSAEGAIVTIEETVNDDVQTFMAAAQMAPVTGTIGPDNTATFNLPAGSYIVTIDATAQGYGVVTATFSVPVEGEVVALDLVPVAPTGTVSVYNAFCGDLVADVTFNPSIDMTDCDPGAGTFTFYLEGDDTNENWQLSVWEDGTGFIDLAEGTYVVVYEETQAQTTITVVAGETTALNVANPGTAPAPRDGTVNVSAFICNNIDEPIISSDSLMTTFAELPTTEPACDPGTATFTFYLVGDDTDDFWQVVADPTNSIQLAPGNYEVVEEGTQARAFITVYPGEFINLDIQIPAGGEVVPGTSVNIVKFYCDTVTETEFLTYDLADYSDRDDLATAPDCVSGAATFTFYLVGDGTADYAQAWVDGAGTIGLEAGTYEVVEEETQAHFTFDVADGENTLLVVNNPVPESGEIPGGGEETPTTPEKESGGAVSELPSTGSGHADGNSSVYMMAAAAAALVAGAGAFVLRRDEAA